jgi:hypothetical protein
MPKTWKELAEELKDLAEIILEQAKQAFKEGDLEKGLMLTKEFRSAIKTAGDLNMIAQGAGELEEDFEEEDLEKALGLEDEENFEEEEEDEEETEEDESDDEDTFEFIGERKVYEDEGEITEDGEINGDGEITGDDWEGYEDEEITGDDFDEYEDEGTVKKGSGYFTNIEEKRKIKNQVGDTFITLDQILHGIQKKTLKRG